MRSILSISYWLTLLLSLVFVLPALLCPEVIMGVFTNDAAIITEGSKYLQVLAWAYPAQGLANVMLMCLRSVGNVRMAIGVYFASFCTNVLFQLGCSSSATSAPPVSRWPAPRLRRRWPAGLSSSPR